MRKQILKNSAFAAMLIGGICCSGNAFAATDAADMPVIMTLRTNIYGYQGPTNSFTIYLGSTEKDCEFYVDGPMTQEYVWVDPYSVGTDSEGNRVPVATPVTLSVTEDRDKIEIHGDPTKIDYIDLHGIYLSSVELSPEFTNLSVIDLSHNELTEVDLSPFTNLASIDILDNAFTDPSKMKIGANHPYLEILSIGINEVCDPELEIKNYPYLQYFSARNNYGLTAVDPSGNPNLVSLVLEVTNISSLDVSNNTKLDVLNISNTKITDIDLSKNVNLGEFYASHEGTYNSEYKLTGIDVSKNTKLQYLDLSGNSLTEIDLTHNPNLVLLYLQRNRLTEIDLSKNTKLASINLSNNLFTFATLPLPQMGWDYYYYRSPLPCYFKYKVGEAIDFSNEVIRAPYTDAQGNTITPATYAAVFVSPRIDNEYELDEDYYTYDNGVITFKKPVDEKVYIKFHCSAFEDWDLQSAEFNVRTAEDYDAPAFAFGFTPDASMAEKTVSLKLAATPLHESLSYPADIFVQTAEGRVKIENAVNKASMPEENNVTFTLPSASSPVEVYVTDGFAISALEIDQVKMSAIDLSQGENLTVLNITNAALPTIDLGFAASLRRLNLSGNSLRTIDFKGARGDYEKWFLTDVNLSGNNLSSLDATMFDTFKNLDLSNNNFSDFDFRYYNGLQNLLMSNNRLSGEVDLSYVDAIKVIDFRDNNISEILLGNKNALTNLDLRGNKLAFSTLPALVGEGVEYNYAPQQEFSIIEAGAAVNLSAQNINRKTSYTWKYAEDGALVPTDLFTLENGVARFSKELIDKQIYCELTNPTFPDFDTMPLKTTAVTVKDTPTNLVASFTTSQDGIASIGFQFNTTGAHAVYIDWNGDGSQYDEYLSDMNGRISYSAGRTAAGKTAKVYTYGDPTEVSMLFMDNTLLTNFDATPMTKAEAFNIHQAGLRDGSIKLPKSDRLFELVLDGNNFTRETFEGYPNLSNLNLAGNRYKNFDLSLYPSVTFAQLANNQIEEIKFGSNTSLYQIDLNGNRLTDINLEGLTYLQELLIPDNLFKTINLSPVQKQLRALNIAGNSFTFETLPKMEDFDESRFTTFYYANQKPINASCKDGQVDLSSLAAVGDTPTVYRWFLGDKQSDVYFDSYYERFEGEELEGAEDSDDPEYVVENGVTSFLYTQKHRVICAMTNEVYPNLILYTTPTEIDKAYSGIEEIIQPSTDQTVDVYTFSGVLVKSQVTRDRALEGLGKGLYIIGNEKVLVK